MKRDFWAGLLIGLGLMIVLLFGYRLAREIRRWTAPPAPPMAAAEDVSIIREWMTIPYLARTYGVPQKVLFEALGVPERQNHWKSLFEIGVEYFDGRSDFVVETVQEAIRAFEGRAPLPPISETPAAAPTP